jgi:hypothetical protein
MPCDRAAFLARDRGSLSPGHRYRVIAANRVPGHATVARFLARHEAALAGLFGSVLVLCARAGLVSSGWSRSDGTKLKANASRGASLDYGRIAREIVAEAKATDEAG